MMTTRRRRNEYNVAEPNNFSPPPNDDEGSLSISIPTCVELRKEDNPFNTSAAIIMQVEYDVMMMLEGLLRCCSVWFGGKFPS